MRKLVVSLACGAVVLCGCARHYVITLNNGTQLSTSSKPHLQGGFYIYKDAMGRESYVWAGRVTEIAPASMAEEGGRQFNPVPGKP